VAAEEAVIQDGLTIKGGLVYPSQKRVDAALGCMERFLDLIDKGGPMSGTMLARELFNITNPEAYFHIIAKAAIATGRVGVKAGMYSAP
tara:strand:- start:187 stop:453 length:267 start_codon:yes stop_codon:yes gene_type:complete